MKLNTERKEKNENEKNCNIVFDCGIEKEIKRFFTEEYLKIMKDELAKEKIENKEIQEIYFRFMNKYLSNLEYKIDEINYSVI